jgi:predicted nucleic-acid-binding protein
MIALDTNVLVRFLVEDDPAQSTAAAALVDDAVRREEQVYVSDVVLAELVWVLERSYGFSRPEISLALRQLFRAAAIQFDSPERIARAIAQYESGKAGLADYLIRQHASDAGAATLYSFGRRLVAESLAVEPD